MGASEETELKHFPFGAPIPSTTALFVNHANHLYYFMMFFLIFCLSSTTAKTNNPAFYVNTLIFQRAKSHCPIYWHSQWIGCTYHKCSQGM